MAHILIIEDDPTINHLIFEYLTENGCTCCQSFSGTEGRLRFDSETFDLILLDLMIPGLTGEELTAHIRSRSNVPIIILSAKTALEDKVGLLDGGADDYLTKPFELEELLARVNVQLRRSCTAVSRMTGVTAPAPALLSYRDWTLDLTGRVFTAAGYHVSLTAHEFGILELFIRHPKKVFTKQEIFEAVWHQDYFVEDKTINVHISNIRAKLKETGTDRYIQTVWGIGFRLENV